MSVETVYNKKDFLMIEMKGSRMFAMMVSIFVLMMGHRLWVSHAQAATFSLSPSTLSAAQECQVSVNVLIDTQGADTNAADLFIDFNPSELEFVDQDAGTPGVQVSPGNVYALYVGNTVNSGAGRVQVTAFNVLGSFQGSGVFATLVFRSRPGVTSANLTIDFVSGASTDSNIADLSSADVLSSVTNGSYTFSAGFCNPDVQAPNVSNILPANSADDVPLSSNVSFTITDNQSGVDLSSLEVQVGTVSYNQSSPQMSISGDPLNYTVVIDPSADFPFNEEIVIVIQAEDLDGNVMPSVVSRFNDPDSQPPNVNAVSPSNGAQNVDLDAVISFTLSDNDTGVDIDSFLIEINGETYDDSSPEVTVGGDTAAYTIEVDPVQDFPFNTQVSFTIEAADLGGNVMTPRTFTFNAPDQQAPQSNLLTPPNNSRFQDLDSDVVVRVTDNDTGVDLDSVQIQVHETNYTASSSTVTVEGTELNYNFTINPATDFPENTQISVVVNASDQGGNVMSAKTYQFNAPSICGDNLVEEGEECEPPGTLACDENCQAVLCLADGGGGRRGGALPEDDQGEGFDEEDSFVQQVSQSPVVESVSEAVFELALQTGLRETPEAVDGVVLDDIEVDPYVCGDVKTESMQYERKEIPYEPPRGYEIIREAVQFGCEGALSTTISIPDEYVDVQALKCVGGDCTTVQVSSSQNVQCGSETLVDEAETEEDAADVRAVSLSASFNPDRYLVTPLEGNSLRYRFNRYQDPVATPKNRSLKLISPVVKLNRLDASEESVSEQIEVKLPYVALSEFPMTDASIQLFAYDLQRDAWDAVPSVVVLSEEQRVTANFDFQDYEDVNGEVILAVMGAACEDCEAARFEPLYRPEGSGGPAIIFVHDLNGSSADWQPLLNDIAATKQPWQAWSYSYPVNQNLNTIAHELSRTLQVYVDDFDVIYFVSHGTGGLVVQEALSHAQRENFINPRRMTFLRKVKKAVLIGTPNKPVESEEELMRFYSAMLERNGGRPVSATLVKSFLQEKRYIPRVPGVEYFVIAGTKQPEQGLSMVVADLVGGGTEGDGLVSTKSAQYVGGEYLNNQCENYWEVAADHFELLEHPSSRKVIGQLISSDMSRYVKGAGLLGRQQYFALADAECSPSDRYLLIGKKVEPEKAPDITGCGCGNGYCGVDEDEVSCPTDCATILRKEYYPRIALGLLIALLVVTSFVVAWRKRRKRD